MGRDLSILSEFSEVKLVLYNTEPFLASVLYTLEIIPTDQEIVACTDGERLWIGIKAWNELTMKEKLGVLLHELSHVIYLHPFLFKAVVNSDEIVNANMLWNLVGDVIINKLLRSHDYVLIKGAVCEFKQISPKCGDLDNVPVRDHSIVYFYEEVLKRLPKKDIIGCGPTRPGGQGKQEEGSGSEEDLRKYGCVKPNSRDEAANRKKGEIKTLWEVNKSIGKIAGDYALIIGKFEATQTPWRELLKKWLTLTQEEDFTFHRPKQYDNVILPRINKMYENKLDLILVIDSSGSIDDATLHKFACEVYSILQSVGRRIYLVVTDADVRLERVIEDVRDIPKEFPGRGGTLFKKAFEAVKRNIFKLDEPVVVVLTDGAIGDLEKLPVLPVPVMWCIVNGLNFVQPFGNKVDIIYN